MALYEHVFLARQDISAQQVDALVEQYKGVLEANGGKVGRVENWGLKSLTYRINKNRKAHYVLMDIDAPAPAVHEIERQGSAHELFAALRPEMLLAADRPLSELLRERPQEVPVAAAIHS